MSKKYKGKTCVYCAENESTTADHVVAREFFLAKRRSGLPKVPACDRCNHEKATLEHYLTTILPFGAKHADAVVNLVTMVPKRLKRNAKLHAKLSVGAAQSPLVVQSPNGTSQQPTSLPFNHAPLERLFALIAKGLAWYHWRVLLGGGYSAIAGVFSDRGAEFIDSALFRQKARDRVAISLGGDTFVYEGLQATDDSRLTVWRFSIYGGVSFGGDPKLRGQRASQIVAVTGPDALIQRLEASVFSSSSS